MPAAEEGAHGPAEGGLEAYLRRLAAAGLDLTAREVAESLWLAKYATPTDSAVAADAAGGKEPANSEPGAGEGRARGHTRSDAPSGTPGGTADLVPPARPGAGGSGPGGGQGGGPGEGAEYVSVRLPAASVLPAAMPLQRALRPLVRYRPPGRQPGVFLDEQATAERAADSGVVVPVLRARSRRLARVRLVMDRSSSTVVWEQLLDEVREVFEATGAFAAVDVAWLEAGEDGVLRLADGGSPARLADPAGRQLTLVLSDCAGPAWRSGRMQRWLHAWAATAPVAVVQPLPEGMWADTQLPARFGVLHRGEGPCGRLTFTPAGGVPMELEGAAETSGTVVPVLAPTRAAFDGWARLVGGGRARSVNAAAGLVYADHPEAAQELPGPEVPARQLVQDFRAEADSQEAVRLAVFLSAVPLWLPVMRLVQRAMLPGTGAEVLAEVLLSGLLRRQAAGEEAGESGESGDPAGEDEGPWFEFLPSVREELLKLLTEGEAALVLKQCSAFVEQHYGRRARNFAAVAVANLSGTAGPAIGGVGGSADDREQRPVPAAFARVTQAVLARFRPVVRPGGGAVPRPEPPDRDAVRVQARRHLDRYEATALIRELDSAIGLFRQAGPPVQLADALLSRWEAAGRPQDLREAWEAASPSARTDAVALLTLGRVYAAMADAVNDAGPACGVLPGWLASELEDEGLPPGRDGTDLALVRLLTLAERVLDDALRLPAEVAPMGLVLTAGVIRAGASRRLAAAGARLARSPSGGLPGQDPDEAFTVPLTGAVRALHVVEARLGRPGEQPAWQRTVLFTRARLGLDLARYQAGEDVAGIRPVSPPAADAVKWAGGAVRDLRKGMDLRLESWPVDDWIRALLDLADAHRLADVPGAERSAVHDALTAARDVAGVGQETLLACLDRAARIEWQDQEANELVLDVVDIALQAVSPGSAGFPRLLALVGRLLLRQGSPRSVEVLREVLDETPPSDPELPERRLLFATALRQRFDHTQAPADLYEAEGSLISVVENSHDPHQLARAWLLRADVTGRLPGHQRQRQAWSYYERAIAYALEVRDFPLALDASRKGVAVLTHIVGPERAAAARDAALERYMRDSAAADAPPDAEARPVPDPEAGPE
ncbi:SAV_2336 N-terminal domain-related protein [Streptomyces boninensis]|uniref:SAV_2336 N-terminal domain-related protein n=1 Tax=Streptomyces boninensis TaxID=2039455 RepID=UPI003B20EF59